MILQILVLKIGKYNKKRVREIKMIGIVRREKKMERVKEVEKAIREIG